MGSMRENKTMRYIYCVKCDKPIRCQSTFYEAVVKGKTHKKKLTETCGMSSPFCKKCFFEQKKDDLCNYISCVKMKHGHCEYKSKEK